MGSPHRFPSALPGDLRWSALAANGDRSCARSFRRHGCAHCFLDKQVFSITFSFTAHANDIFSPRQFEIGLDKLVDTARAIVTETDYAALFLRDRFSHHADRVHRIYNGLDLAEFGRADFS